MPPIPVHLDDPIVAQKPDGTTPQTEPPPTQTQPDAPTTTTATTPQAYPAARPGAAAVPAPTGYVPNPPPQPTRTTQAIQDGPPAPQPGAVPVPSMQQVTASTLPPPPKAGEAAKAREAGATQFPTQMPPQMSIPAPGMNYAPTHSTSTATTVNLGPVAPAAPTGVPTAPYQPPEGYRQDTNAQEMSAAQRSSLEEQQRRESVFANVSVGGGGGATGTGTGIGIGGAGGAAEGVGAQAAQAWSAVKGVLGTAGEKLAEVEGDVWRRINGGK